MDNNFLSIKNRRAVAPIIATLILVAIAVVGGVMIFVFAQDFFGGESMTGPGTIDTISLAGYDMRDVAAAANISAHDGNTIACADCSVDQKLMDDADIGAIYIKNNGGGDVIIRSVVIAGATYNPIAAGVDTVLSTNFNGGSFSVYTSTLDGTSVIPSTTQTIPGQDTGSIYFRTSDTISNGRTIGVAVTTGTGQEFNFNVVVGQTS